MFEFLRQQMDYIYFIYGLSFIVLAAVCFTQRKPDVPRLPWVWLGLFGASHGSLELLEIPAYSMGDSSWLVAIRMVLKFMSFVFLLEFGRSGMVAVRGKGPGRWALLPLLVVGLLGGIAGRTGFDVSCRYALGLTGGIWSAITLFAGSRKTDKRIGSLLAAAGIAMLLYAIAAGVITAKASFFPASLINQDKLFDVLGIPVQLLRGIIGGCIATFTWLYFLANREYTGRHTQYRIGVSAAALVMAILIGGWIAASSYSSYDGGHRLSIIVICFLLCSLVMMVATMLHNVQESNVRIAASEARYRSVIEGSPNCVFLFDNGGRCLTVNKRVLTTFGRNEDDVIGHVFSSVWPEDLCRSVDDAVETALKGSRASLETYCVGLSGERSEWRVVLNPIPDQDSNRWRVVGICTDVTELKRAEANLDVQAAAINAASNQILITDTEGRIEFVNPAFETETGYEADEVIGKTSRLLQSGKHDRTFYTGLWNTILTGDTWHGEITNRRKDGSFCIDDVRIAPVKNAGGVVEHFVAIKSNITDKKLYEKQLDHMAHHDSLTGLPNRMLFSRRLSQYLVQSERRKQMLAVLFLDLDRFKLVNDTMGHSVGDLMLKTIATRLPLALRKNDMVARMGGDEFTIILPHIESINDVTMISQRILTSLSEPLLLDGHEFLATASIGISLYPEDGVDAETLLKNADSAMYRAKEQGGNAYCFYKEDLNTASIQQMKLQNSLRKAVEREEFIVYYQPVSDIATGEILGAEALVRWQHPELGLLPPARFIPLAEMTDLIVPITESVLRAACIQNKSWQNEGLAHMGIAVNISARVIARGELSRTVQRVLQETGLDPQYLILELTESVLMQDSSSTAAVLDELKALGVRIAIDDFGTGYSSLSYLRRLPIDVLKIDRSFVKDVITDPDDAAITGAIVAMAHSLKLKVIAEGVETTDQLKFLHSLKCDEMQGYLSSMPVPADEFVRLMWHRESGSPGKAIDAA